MVTNIHMFFTAWVILLVLFHKHTHKYVDLRYLTFVTMLSGLYISTIHPRQYTFWLLDEKYTLKSWDRFIIVDMFFHIGAFIFIASIYKTGGFTSRSILSAGLICLYSLLIDSQKVYSIRKFEILSVIICSTLLYVILSSQK